MGFCFIFNFTLLKTSIILNFRLLDSIFIIICYPFVFIYCYMSFFFYKTRKYLAKNLNLSVSSSWHHFSSFLSICLGHCWLFIKSLFPCGLSLHFLIYFFYNSPLGESWLWSVLNEYARILSNGWDSALSWVFWCFQFIQQHLLSDWK